MSIRLSISVMAHRQRAKMALALHGKLTSDIRVDPLLTELKPGFVEPGFIVWDQLNDRWDTGRRSLLNYSTSATHHMVIQDDAIIPRNLPQAAINAYDYLPLDSPLSFYIGGVRPMKREMKTLMSELRNAEKANLPPPSFVKMPEIYWGVGLVIPVTQIPSIVDFGDSIPTVTNYDRKIGRYYKNTGTPCYYTWPSLVDHRDSPSLIKNRTATRQARKFVGEDVDVGKIEWNSRAIVLNGPRNDNGGVGNFEEIGR